MAARPGAVGDAGSVRRNNTAAICPAHIHRRGTVVGDCDLGRPGGKLHVEAVGGARHPAEVNVSAAGDATGKAGAAEPGGEVRAGQIHRALELHAVGESGLTAGVDSSGGILSDDR